VIARLWARLRYLGRTAFVGLRGSPVTSAVAVVTITVSLVLVGAFALLVSNMEGLLARFGQQVRLTAYLAESVDEHAARALVARIGEREEVESAAFVSKDAALARFRERVGGALLEGLDDNPLPASLEVTLAPAFRSPTGLEHVATVLESLDGVDEVARGHAWVESYARAVALLRAGGFVLGGVLVLAALLIVANTMRLAVYARRDELEILLLVGATRSFVAIPFLLEGLVQGLLGGLAALGLLYGVYLGIGGQLQDALAFLLGGAPPGFLGASGCLALVGGGAALGAVGSAAAVFQGLRA